MAEQRVRRGKQPERVALQISRWGDFASLVPNAPQTAIEDKDDDEYENDDQSGSPPSVYSTTPRGDFRALLFQRARRPVGLLSIEV